MTNEQAKRLDAAIAKAGLNWWEVQRQVGFDVFNDVKAIETTIAAIEKMAKEEATEEAATEAPTERKCFTVEDVEKVIYTMDQWSNDGTFSAEVGQEVSEEVYFQMFNAMPPLRLPRECGYLSGFRMGEPYTHEQSETTGEFLGHYAAFGKKGGKYYFLGRLNKYGEMCSSDRRENKRNEGEEIILVKYTDHGRLEKHIKENTVITFAIGRSDTYYTKRKIREDLRYNSKDEYIKALLRHGFIKSDKALKA